MGCGSSRKVTGAIEAFGSPKRQNRPASAPTDHSAVAGKAEGRSILSFGRQKKPSSAASRKDQRPESGRAATGSAVAALRAGSANSDRSFDSGIGGESRNGSAAAGNATLPPPGPRLAQQLPPELGTLKTGDRPRPRIDEETILASLRQEGLLGAPNTSTSKGGLCFEVPAEELKVRSRRPPPRLQRLEPMKHDSMTDDRIRQKLATAETRRKKRENEKVQRNREKDAKQLEAKLASLDADASQEPSETQKSSQDRIVSAKHRRRPPSAPVATIPALEPGELDVMTPKASPLVIDEVPVGHAAKQDMF